MQRNYTFSISRRPYWSLYWVRLQISVRHPISFVFLVGPTAFSLTALLYHFSKLHVPTPSQLVTMLLIGLAPYLFVALTTLVQRLPTLYNECPTTYAISDHGFSYGNRWYHVVLSWPLVKRVRFTRTDAFFYTSASVAHVIPLSDILSVAPLDELRAFIEQAKSAHEAGRVA